MSVLIWGLLAPAWAHVPNIASYNLDTQADQCVLRISLPTDGMHQALKLEHPELVLSELDTAAYQALLTQTLLDGIALELDGVAAPLEHCEVSLTSHETQALCTLAAPSPAYRVTARIDALSAQSGQNNVLRVTTHPQAGHIVLKENNGFQGSLQLGEAEPPSEREWPWALGSLFVFPALLGLWTLSSRPSEGQPKS